MKLTLRNVRVWVDLPAQAGGKEILHGVSFSIAPGEVHAVMGPNGSGKSTLAYGLMAHPAYKVKGNILLGSKKLNQLTTEARAKRGLFLTLQSPLAIPGVSVTNLLRRAYQEVHPLSLRSSRQVYQKHPIQNPLLSRRWKGADMSLAEFSAKLKENANFLHLDESFLSRGINDGFSGGEKKKVEMLQALMLEPKFVIFDEIDTGLDVDALKTVASGIELLRKKGVGVLLITHYQRILKYVVPDMVHVMVGGRIVKSGKAALAEKIEREGYSTYDSNTSNYR